MAGRTQQSAEIVVVGGGLAGLTAATYLARAGRSVALFERSRDVGGRAVTQQRNGFHFNWGPHALYREGPGIKILGELGIEFSGGTPATEGYALHQGVLRKLPAGLWSLFTTGLLGFAAKLEAARFLSSVGRIDAQDIHGVSWVEWLDTKVCRQEARQLLTALVRLTTYTNDPERLSADVAIEQLQLGLKGVYYLDSGWQVLVDGLRNAAEKTGVRIVTSATVAAIERDGEMHVVRLKDGATHVASAVLIATPPAVAVALIDGLEGTGLREWCEAVLPVRAASLDIGLSRLPQPRARFVLGIDRPLYLSTHSSVANLAPKGGAMIHVSKYLPSDEDDEELDPKLVERELEELLDLAQPGWRNVLVERRFVPKMVVVSALTTAAQGGLTGRPGSEVVGIRNLYLAGDWVGPEGWLSDASRLSAKRAAEAILRAGGAGH